MPVRAVFLSILLAALPAMADGPNLLANAALETQAGGVMPTGWYATGDGADLAIEPGTPPGERRVRLAKKPGTQFGGFAQTVDAVPLRGRILDLEVTLGGRGLAGAHGLYFRVDSAERRSMIFLNTYAEPVVGDAVGVRKTLRVVVPREATSLQVGVMNAGEGALTGQGFRLAAFRPEDAKALSDLASTYLDAAIAIVRENALNRANVDWPAVEKQARVLASGAANEAATYPAISFVLTSLQDRHSHLLTPRASQHSATNARTDDFGIASAMVRGRPYIKIPAYSGTGAARSAAFAEDIRKRIATLDPEGTRAWIVDLRENGGGNTWPMLNGLVPLLGEGRIGAFQSDRNTAPWVVRNGVATTESSADGGAGIPPAKTRRVAVLTGSMTASSGETVVVAFRGTPNTRSFGGSTAGLSTANRPFGLADGASILLTVSRFVDRSGVVYGSHVVPDEAVAAPAKGTPLEEDPVVAAAVAWLDTTAPASTK
jgi:carboxyl-terminal processing protease